MNEISFEPQDNVMSRMNVPEIDLAHYYRLMLRNLWKIILFSLVVGVFTTLYALSLPPVYNSNTTLLIEDLQPNVLSFQDIYQVDTGNRRYLATQLQILKSRSLAEQVADRMRKERHSLFLLPQKQEQPSKLSVQYFLQLLRPLLNGQSSQENNAFIPSKESAQGNLDTSRRDVAIAESGTGAVDDKVSGEMLTHKRIVDMLVQSLVIAPVRNTLLVNIGFSAQDPQVAADVANMVAEVYIESHLEAKLEVTQKATNWLSSRLSALRQKLRESEKALQSFRESEKLVDSGGLSIDVAELEQLTQSLVEARSKRTDAGALYRQMVVGSPPLEDLLALPVVSGNPLVQNVMELRATAKRKVAELGKRYGSKHPQMLSALSELRELERELGVQVKSVARGVEVNYQAAKEAEQFLKSQIAAAKKRLQDVNRKEFSLRELEREVDANRQLYEVFLNRGKETNEAGGLETVHARVIDAAIPAEYPIKPEKKKIVLISLIFSAAFAAGIILLLDWLDNTIKTPEDVEERLGVPLLGYLPLNKENKDDTPFLGFLSDAPGNFAEAVRTIRTGFILSALDKPSKVTVVTSSVPNEGKSTVSLCLAQALGQMEKVLLVDADMRRPSIGKVFDISLLTPGLSNLIAGTAELEECITRLPDSELSIITAGVVLGNPLDLLASERFVQVMEMLRKNFDRIIIDSAPIQAVSDSLVIAMHADALVYIVQSDGSSTPLVKRGLRRLSESSARFSGVVLNKVDIEKMKKASDYESDYYENYGYVDPPVS